MIAAIQGRIFALSPGRVEVLTGSGLVVQVQVPVSSFPQLATETDILLYTVVKIKDEDIVVYGFVNQREKMIFERLLSVSGVGGKIALSCISAFAAPELINAINGGDVEKLSSIPGIGRKTAQRIILELTGKLELEKEEGDEQLRLKDDLISGLVNLGYPVKTARDKVGLMLKDHPQEKDFETLFKQLLRKMNP